MIVRRLVIFFVVVLCFSSFCQAEEYQFERSCTLNVYDGINTNYGEFRSFSDYTNHDGIDYQALVGTPVYPVVAGIAYPHEADDTLWGRYIIVDHGNFKTRYVHLDSIKIKRKGNE